MAWIIFGLALRAETVLLPCLADTSLFENNPTNNLGGDPTLPAGTTAHGLGARALLRFDLSQIPTNSVVTSAAVQLTVVKASSLAAVDSAFQLHRVLLPWGEGTKSGSVGAGASPDEATWLARFAPATLWTVPGGEMSTDFADVASATVPITQPGPYLFGPAPELLADVRFWLDHPEANFGWLLRSQKEQVPGTARRFGSREDASHAPVLVVDYSAPDLPLTMSVIPISTNTANLVWLGGQPLYQLQRKLSLSETNWTNVNGPVQTKSTSIPLEGSESFFRVIGAGATLAKPF